VSEVTTAEAPAKPDMAAALAQWERWLRTLACRYAKMVGFDPSDIYGEAVYFAVRGWHRYDPARGVVGTWLTVCVRAAVGKMRRDRRKSVPAQQLTAADSPEETADLAHIVEADGPEPVDEAAAAERRDRVRAALAALPSREQELVCRPYLAGADELARRLTEREQAELAAAVAKLRASLSDLQAGAE
jgi:RNA polymerase sigma factor (sigma-70 family)